MAGLSGVGLPACLPHGRWMMQAVAALAAASAAAAAALVASATAFASRASTSVRGARLACTGYTEVQAWALLTSGMLNLWNAQLFKGVVHVQTSLSLPPSLPPAPPSPPATQHVP